MKLSLIEIYTYYEHWKKLSHKERGDYVDELASGIGVHPSTFYRAFKEIPNGNGRADAYRKDRRKPRYKDMTAEECALAASRVSAMKMAAATKNGKTADTASCVRALFNAGEIRYGIPTSTMNRWLDWHGFTYRQIRNYLASTGVELATDEPNKWMFLDFSVSEIFYLSRSDKLVMDTTGILTDKNHREELLTKKGYRKVFIGCVVDLFSSAYWVNAYVSPGESNYLVMNFLMDAMSAKSDPQNPFRGIPQNIYCDRGSALHSQQLKDIFEPLGIKIWSHIPGNPRAKGRVESRIGHYKNTIERCFAFERPDSIERYREITQKMITADNIKKGYFTKWMEIHKTPGLLREFDETLRGRLGYTMIERKVDVRGRVSIEGQEYYVSRMLNDQRVAIYTLLDGIMKAVDKHGNTYELKGTAHQQRMMGEYKGIEKTVYDRALDSIKIEGKRLRGVIKPEHFAETLPENIVLFDRKGAAVDVSTPLDVPVIATVESAWLRVYRSTGFSKNTLPHDTAEKITMLFGAMIEMDGEVPPERFSEILEIITDTVREVRAL
ncbi:MAG: transposase [Spirochaetes bacterium]|nr:MAG: transposase [Spirochaetota bacterium]